MNENEVDAATIKRPVESSEEDTMSKKMRMNDGELAVLGCTQQQDNLLFMGSQPTDQQTPPQLTTLSMDQNVPTTQEEHMQMQLQQRQQQQYAAAMASGNNAQQLQQAVPMTQNPGANFNVASSISHQEASKTVPEPQVSASAVPLASVTSNGTEEPCLLCRKVGDIFACNGGCGLHVHPACIGEDAIFPFVVGQLCGSCFIVQQNRASPEDLTKGGAHALSVRRAILCVNLETNNNMNFDKFGHLASLRLGEIGSIAGYPLKPFAEKFVEPYLQRWIREKLATADKWMLNVREIFTVMIGLYSLKRACIAHGLHDKVIELMKARKFTVIDFFGWHPAIEGPHVRCSSLCAICGIRNLPEVDTCTRCHHKLVFPTVFTKYISTLLAAFYAEQVGIPLGASTLDVFAHTNVVRGLYRGLLPFDSDGFSWELFTDQLRMIFGFLDIMSNFGTLQLNPDLFIPEVSIIFNPAYVNQAMITNEFEVVGKFLQCMRLFGDAKSKENENMIQSCERYLLFKHLPNGSWCKINGSTVDQYKATVTCAKALLTPSFRGYGPISREFQRLLEKWSRNASPKLPSAATAGVKQATDTNKLKLLASGATLNTSTLARFKRLETMYKCQIAPKGGHYSLESLMTDRIKRLFQAKSKTGSIDDDNSEINRTAKVVSKNEPAKDEKATVEGTTDSEDTKHRQSSGTHAQSQEEEDMLTSMSLQQDLEIFDGLQFEDGGGIIDMTLGPHGNVDNGGEQHTMEDIDTTDAPAQDEDVDETMDSHMVDDDEDENEDNSNPTADLDTPQQSNLLALANESDEAATDFPGM